MGDRLYQLLAYGFAAGIGFAAVVPPRRRAGLMDWAAPLGRALPIMCSLGRIGYKGPYKLFSKFAGRRDGPVGPTQRG